MCAGRVGVVSDVTKRGLPWRRFLVVAALVALDLWSKSSVFAWLASGVPPEGMVISDAGHLRFPLPEGSPRNHWFAFMPSTNPGAAFGKLKEWPWLLVMGRIVAALVLIALLVRRQPKVVMVALVLVLAGALGNLYDNLFLESPVGRPFGEVRDFIDVYFSIWRWHFPTFNVADSCISVGAVLLLVSSFRREEEPQDAEAPAESSPGASA